MSAEGVKWTVASAQDKIFSYSVEEAKAKAEKAQVELETAKLQQEYVKGLIDRDLGSGIKVEDIKFKI